MKQKHADRRFLIFCWPVLAVLLPGCTEMDGQINQLQEKIVNTQASNNESVTEIQKLNQDISNAQQRVRAQEARRAEFAAKSTKSATLERTFVKYRTELETSLADLATAVKEYRKKHLAP